MCVRLSLSVYAMVRKVSAIALLASAVLILAAVVFYAPGNLDPESIRGKRVLITGASSGIGEQLAYVYSRSGATVVLTARRGAQLKRVADKCRELGAERVEYVVADMALAEDRETLMRQVEKKLLAGKSLDHLILNHALFVTGPFVGGANNMTNLERDLQVNFVSYVDLATRCLRMLSASADGGHIGVVSSAAGKIGAPFMASYAADKFALQGFFASWRQELRANSMATKKPPVLVTLCVLGYISTEAANNIMHSQYPKMQAMMPSPPGADEAALAIVNGVTRNYREIVFPRMDSFIVAAHQITGAYFEDLLISYML